MDSENSEVEAGFSCSTSISHRVEGEAMQARLTADKAAWHQHLKAYSTEMRRKPTEAENALWQVLRNRQLCNVKFRRQHAIGRFIVDFFSPDHQLIIEVDGDVHAESEQTEYDTGRTYELQKQGYHIVRFTNAQVLNGLPQVLAQISQNLQLPL